MGDLRCSSLSRYTEYNIFEKYVPLRIRSKMISPNLLEIERSVRALSVEEQLWLLESIARQIRESEYTKDKFPDAKHPEEQLEVIVNEAKIPVEIAAITDEFAISEIL